MAGEVLNQLIYKPVLTIWDGISVAAPKFLLALILIIVGYLIGLLVGFALEIVLKKAGLDRQVEKAKLSQIVGHIKISAIIGEIAKWFIFIAFLSQAVDKLELGILSDLLVKFAEWLPSLVAGILIIIFGLVLVNLIAVKIEQHSEVKGTRMLVRIIKIFFIIAVVIMGFEQMQLKTGVVEQVFVELVRALSWAIAIAIGIGFGFGMKDEFKKESKGFVKELKDLIHH